MAHRLIMIAIDGSDHSEKAFQCTSCFFLLNYADMHATQAT